MITTILIAILGFVVIASLGFVFVGGGNSADRALKRAESFTTNSGMAKRNTRVQPGAKAEDRRKQIVNQLKLSERNARKARVTIAGKLQQAGLSTKPSTFWIISAVLGVTVTGLVYFFSSKALIALGLGFAAGLGLPRWVVNFIGKGRIKKFTGEFANAVDVIVRGIKSGLPVHDCFKIIAREFGAPLGPEFQRLVENIAMGVTVEEALEKMYQRMPTSELRFFTIVMAIQSKTGGNLAEALGNLSAVLRSRRMMREKVKAMSSEATASAGIIGSMPPGVMTLVLVTAPQYMGLMFSDPRGNMMLMGGVLWMSCGIFVMKKMIDFKI
jgi:tight adherence protein B